MRLSFRIFKVALAVCTLAGLFCLPVSAKTVPISDTGYTLDIPDHFKVSRPGNAPNILLHCSSPTGEAYVQVVRAAPGSPEQNMAANYENTMRQALPGMQQVKSGRRNVAGGSALFKQYQAQDGNTNVRIMTLFYSSPDQAFVLHSLDQNGDRKMLLHTLTSLSSSRRAGTPAGKAMPPARADAPDRAGAFRYRVLSVDDGGFEFLYPDHYRRFQQSPGQSQWADPGAEGSKVVMVIQSMMRSAGNSAKSVYEGLISQVKHNRASTLISSRATRLNGIPAYTLHFTLRQQGRITHFKYVVLDLPGPNVATVSFVGPAPLLGEIDQHYEQLLKSVRLMRPSR